MKTFRMMMMLSFMMLVAITTTCGVVGEGNDVVYDGEGEPVKPNVPYYISFMTSDYNMWICRKNMGSSSSDPKSCPQQPVMFTNPSIAPTPVLFILPSKSDTVVRESAKLKIKFVNPRHCGESGFWRVVQKTNLEGEVMLNGSKSSNDTTFSIHKTNEYYKFTYGDGDGDGDVDSPTTTISLSNEYPIYRLLSKKYSGEMEIYFYRTMP